MGYDEVFAIMRGAVSEMFDVSEDDIDRDTLFDDDLYADEFDAQELMMIAEEEFGIGPLTMKMIKGIGSFGDAVDFIVREMKK